MTDPVKPTRRTYNAPRREAAAAATHAAILRAAQSVFEARGWGGATVAGVAAAAEVSPKTVEALFGTKAALLAATVTYALRGGTDETPMADTAPARRFEAAADAPTAIPLHLDYSLPITARSARLALVVETAAGADERVGALWARMTHNRRFGARWAAAAMLDKPGLRPGLGLTQAERCYLIGIDWATYRTLAGELGLSERQVRGWLQTYYERMLLPAGGADLGGA